MLAFAKRQIALLQSKKIELALSVRVTVAAMGALVIALALGLKLPLWAVLTSLIATQMSVGQSLKATRDYLLATLGGAVYGGAVAVLVPHNGEGALLAVLVLAVTPLAFIAAINPSLKAATVTAIIVLLLPTMNHGTPLASAVDRVLEVAVGALTGLAVSFLVLPSRAHHQIRLKAAAALELIAAALNEMMAGLTRGRDVEALHRLQDGIGTALVGLNAIGAEAERERAAHLTTGPYTGPLLRTVLRLRHDLVIIGRATAVPMPPELHARLDAPLANANQAIGGCLKQIAGVLRTGGDCPPISAVHAALQAYAAEVAMLRSEGMTRGLAGEDIERFFALGFSLEQMRRDMKDLERCAGAWAERPMAPDDAESD
jgi:hypothetical protein